MIEIKNLHYERPRQEWDVKVDRSSTLGNPFVMRHEGERDEVCDKYKKWFYDNFGALKPELRRLWRLHRKHGKLNLFCWCAPKRCHAETIKAFLEKARA